MLIDFIKKLYIFSKVICQTLRSFKTIQPKNMQIWIITSGLDNIQLFHILHKYDHHYHILRDQANGPYDHNTFSQNIATIKQNIQTLKSKWADKIILPPIYELYFHNKNKHTKTILPIFQNYILEYAFKYSLVGKIGFVGWLWAIDQIQDLIQPLAQDYQLTQRQQKIKKFHQPFAIWRKKTILWNDLLKTLGTNHWMINKLIKTDLKYFKDANVDTLIPLSYGYLAYDKTLRSHLNFKKIRYHDISKLENIIQNLLSNDETSKYDISLYSRGNTHFLDKKKRKWLLARGKQIDIKKKSID